MSDDFIFRGPVAELDPELTQILAREKARQATTIILIASESEAPEAVSEALTSVFGNIYAEGYPREESRRQTEAEITDMDMELAHYRRYPLVQRHHGHEAHHHKTQRNIVRRKLRRAKAAHHKADEDPPRRHVHKHAQPRGKPDTDQFTATHRMVCPIGPRLERRVKLGAQKHPKKYDKLKQLR